MPDMATAVSNLAALHGASQRLEEAEREYTEALEIYNQLALWSPEAFEPLLANTLCNWALLKQMAGDEENSRHLANMGLEVYRRCEERCPGEYEDKLAWSLSIAGREE